MESLLEWTREQNGAQRARLRAGLLSQVGSLMLVEARAPAEALAAAGALVGLLTCVHPLVPVEVGPLDEALLTHGGLKVSDHTIVIILVRKIFFCTVLLYIHATSS